MNKTQYMSDSRYASVFLKMEMLGIMDITTTRQHKNGTVVWQLPIKNKWPSLNGIQSYIRVASFSTGYVRNQNSGYSNYQLNKRCESEPQYYPVYEWCDESNMSVKTDKFRQYTTRSCKLIPIEIDRLEYLISYCLKNYYIKRANEIADGKYVPQWYHNDGIARWRDSEVNKINDLEEKLDAMTEDRDSHVDYQIKLEEKLFDLQNKLATINRISDNG